MKDYSIILNSPVISEKASALKELKKYVFRVSVDSNKIMIKKAVEDLYKVEVESVNVINMKPKYKRIRGNYGFTRHWKKAVVTLRKGEIDFYKA